MSVARIDAAGVLAGRVVPPEPVTSVTLFGAELVPGVDYELDLERALLLIPRGTPLHAVRVNGLPFPEWLRRNCGY